MEVATVGISWNGAKNWDNNRFWENLAAGLAQVAERPRIQIPHEPVDGEEVVYVDRPEEVAPAVLKLVCDPDRAMRMQAGAYARFLRHHSSEARARYLMVEALKA
jgi:spore maturation protein CgeB